MRLDDVELKGFAGRRAIHAVVPGDDPGLASFIAGRHALDQRRLAEALEELGRVDRGALARAARVVTEGVQNASRTPNTSNA